eukprot:NODE_62_length_26495_cov_0.832853.p1 type:complete len:877 gc:universal NODE_62_length_26495_cov_0.832853:609-3239(+)
MDELLGQLLQKERRKSGASESDDPTDLFKLLKHRSSMVRAYIYKEIRRQIIVFHPYLYLIDLYVLKSMTMPISEELDQVMMLIQAWIQYELPFSILYALISYSKEGEYISKICTGLIIECNILHPELKLAYHLATLNEWDWRVSDRSIYILLAMMENKTSRQCLPDVQLPLIQPYIDPETTENVNLSQNIITTVFMMFDCWHGIFYLKRYSSLWGCIVNIISARNASTEKFLVHFDDFLKDKLVQTELNYLSIIKLNLATEIIKELINYKVLDEIILILPVSQFRDRASSILKLLYKYGNKILNYHLPLEIVHHIFDTAAYFKDSTADHINPSVELKMSEYKSEYFNNCQQMFKIDNLFKEFKRDAYFPIQLSRKRSGMYAIHGYHADSTQLFKQFNDAMCTSNTFNKFELWRFDIIFTCLYQIQNDNLLAEFVNSKYFKRLVQFYTISNSEYCSLVAENKLMYDVFELLFRILLASETGYKSLVNHDFMIQLRENLKCSLPGTLDRVNYFTPNTIEQTNVKFYFKIIHVISCYDFGVRLFSDHSIFTVLIQIADKSSNEMLLLKIMQNLDYSLPSYSRVLLTKFLNHPIPSIRIAALEQFNDLKTDEFKIFALKMLVELLHDINKEVQMKASNIILEILKEKKYIQIMATYKPNIQKLKINKKLLYTMMSVPDGFEYLSDFLVDELHIWASVLNSKYVVDHDALFSSKMLDRNHIVGTFEQRKFDKEIIHDFQFVDEPHLFQYICRTKNGYTHLRASCELDHMVSYLRNFSGNGDYKKCVILRGILVAFGYLSMSLNGLHCIEDHNVVQIIVELAHSSSNISIRGTCFHVLCMVGSTKQGHERLKALKWSSTIHNETTLYIDCGPIPSTDFYDVF